MKLRQTGKKRNLRSLLGFELFLKTAGLSFSFPLFRGMFTFCLWAAGYSYLTKENFINFILSPCVLVCSLVLFITVSFFAVLEVNAVGIAVQREYTGGALSFPELFFGSLKETVCFFRKTGKGIRRTLCCLLFVFFINVPIVLFLLAGFGQSGDETGNFSRLVGIFLFFLGAAGIIGFLCTKRESILHGMIQRGFLLYLAEAGVYLVGLLFLILFVVNSTDSAVSGVLILRLFERYHLICGIVFASVNTVVFEYFCMRMLLRDKEPEKDKKLEEKAKSQKEARRRICLWFACVLVFCTTVTQTVAFFRNKSVLLSEALEELCITAHRGASDGAPENTMASIALAVDEGADYAEIDVRLTADGVPVLLHDRALFRTTGVLKNVDQVTYQELLELDAGKGYARAFTGERVPRLKDVFMKYGGKIGFNIELKEKDDRVLVFQVAELIEEYGLEDSCIITSASYRQLEWVKERNRTLKTGYILSLVYGDFYTGQAADFFSIRSDFITEDVVKKAHALGKEVHAWTVNRENELKRMKAIGVDNIITDKPAYAREIIKKNPLADTLGEWMALLTSQK